MKKAVEKLDFNTVELMNELVKNQGLRKMMGHLCQNSKYGESLSKFNRNDLQQIVQKLELKESNLRLLKDWKCQTWISIYSLQPKFLKETILTHPSPWY